ncbi:uncharacterized protein [Henckelia pumila]|uniref:uncharacterized protein n=1 Tax=Henckelia pumila TaxID=405737 RepID=UPI003C6E4F57
MSNYSKFIKEVMSKKIRLRENEVVNLNEECSFVLQKKMPQKLKDPGSFTIHCSIGGSHITRTLCNLEASINLIPLSIYRALELEEMKSTMITLQLTDRSITYPRGIVEDVLVKVDKFIFPDDFVNMDMEEDHAAPLILGDHFLLLLMPKIYVKNDELTMGLEGEKFIFNIFKKAINSTIEELCLIERVKKLDYHHKAISEVESSKEKEPSVPKKKNPKKKAKFKKQIVEYIWRVKEKGKTLPKVTTA